MDAAKSGELPAETVGFGDDWGDEWTFRGHTVSAVLPVAPIVFPRTHKGKPKGKRRWEPAVVYPNGAAFARILFKSKDKAMGWAKMMYELGVARYQCEHTLHRCDQIEIKQENFWRTIGKQVGSDGI
jgi:hypothetical protein